MARLWRYITGKQGVSRVRVYERYEDSPIQIEWYVQGERYQRSLRTFAGEPIRDRKMARRIAEEFADQLEQNHNRGLNRKLWGITEDRTLGELLARLHEDRGESWSKSYARDQKRYREWWTEKLGADLRLSDANAAMVEAIAMREAKDREWSARTHGAYLRYVVDAFYYADRKLKWVDPLDNLSAVDIPSPKSKGRAYTLAELRKLLPALEDVNVVAGWIGHVLWQTGRRLTATMTLPRTAVEPSPEHSTVTWPGETDKARKGGVSVVVGRAHDLTAHLLRERGGRYVVGVDSPDMDTAQDWMREAEERAGVKHVKGRSWHGIKRRYGDRTEGMKSRAAQSGTREDTLRRVYDPMDDVAAMKEVAELLAREVEVSYD